jgi:hypothetical protein
VNVVVRVTNLDRDPIVITGAEASFDAGAVDAVTPDSLPVTAGGSAEVVAHAAVDCRSPTPLRLYPLQIRLGDHSLTTIPVVGATAVLARICQAQGPALRVLDLVAVTPQPDHRLRVTLTSPTGRTTQVLGLHAGGVPLDARPLPGSVARDAVTFWIDPPDRCPAEWQAVGLPRTLTVDGDTGGPVSVTVDAGYPLARWLRAGPCAGGGP